MPGQILVFVSICKSLRLDKKQRQHRDTKQPSQLYTSPIGSFRKTKQNHTADRPSCGAGAPLVGQAIRLPARASHRRITNSTSETAELLCPGQSAFIRHTERRAFFPSMECVEGTNKRGGECAKESQGCRQGPLAGRCFQARSLSVGLDYRSRLSGPDPGSESVRQERLCGPQHPDGRSADPGTVGQDLTQPILRFEVLPRMPVNPLLGGGYGQIEGRPPGPDWAYQRWNEFVPTSNRTADSGAIRSAATNTTDIIARRTTASRERSFFRPVL